MGSSIGKIANGGGMLYPFRGKWPEIAADCFIAPGARIIGDVKIDAGSSVWFNVVIRGDVGQVRIGKNTNIQDGTVIHVSSGGIDTHIGDDVLIGHMAMIHGTTIENGGFVGFNGSMMDNSRISSQGMLAAGSLLSPGKNIGARELWIGRPAKFSREMNEVELANNVVGSDRYKKIAKEYLKEYKTER